MSTGAKYLALDLGAESGRGLLATLNDSKLDLKEVHRFPNGPVRMHGTLYWNFLGLLDNLKQAVRAAAADNELQGIGIDTWGVDFGLLAADGELLGNPVHYRDSRTDGMLEAAFDIVPRERIFDYTGIQFMKLNTLYQLLAMKRAGSKILEVADTLLLMPDLLNYCFAGTKVSEFSIATTTQFYDPRQGDWAREMLHRLDLPTDILPEIVPPGTVLGPILPSLQAELGIGPVPVIAPACHDTGSAVAAVPAAAEDYAYISSGTWSLMGIETAKPLITDQTLALNFTNEGGVCDTIRFLKNIMGLWLVQECRRHWEQEGHVFSYSDLTDLAAAAKPFVSIVDPDDESFISPGDMPAKIAAACRKHGEPEPDDYGAFVRCALESLALKYRWVLERLEEVGGRPLAAVHILGGGTQNKLLCQLAADAMNRPVIAGPIEATAIGNVLMQAIARGQLASLAEAREVVRRSFDLVTYEPKPSQAWDDAYGRFLRIIGA